MSEFHVIETFHGTILAVYNATGAVCAVPDSQIGSAFTRLILYAKTLQAGQPAFLIPEIATRGLFIRPFVLLSRLIPVILAEGGEPAYIALAYPSLPGETLYLCAVPLMRNTHFSRVTADRKAVAGWESFRPVTLAQSMAGDHLSATANFIDEHARHMGLIDAYSQGFDDRLAACLPNREWLPVRDIVTRFESLGENCEFGFLQRICGAEPIGLFRFAGGIMNYDLAAAIRGRFATIGRADDLVAEPHPKEPFEYLISDRNSHFNYHTWRTQTTELGQIVAEEGGKLQFLRRKLVEDMEDASKIFVVTTRSGSDEAALDEIFNAIREIGPAPLLSVVRSDEDHPAGTVVELREGFLRGFIDEFAERPWQPAIQQWLGLCRTALALRPEFIPRKSIANRV